MQLTRHTDYSLRILIYLAVHEGERVTLTEIADAFGISLNHLNKVLHGLTGLGAVKTFRGKHGGITLAQDPEKIRVGHVVRHMESTLQIIDCMSPHCPILPACELRGVLNDARDAFLQVLDGYTLAELVGQKQAKLQQLLHA
ncbi:MAG: Rrf2 family transcriptional regulator [Acidiferrobacteraceae bacterium]|jgi:Rrf2 family nitric oxide-sensitive transcriptional repressor